MTKTILVTGANRGIGLEIVRQYAESGCTVLACCRSPDSATELQNLAKSNSYISIHQLDVCDETQIIKLAEKLNDISIDILFNNAGVAGSGVAFGEVKFNDLIDTFKTDAAAPVMVAQAFIPHVAKSQKKLIVNMSSLLGSIELNTDNSWGWFSYRVSKSALNSATRCMANQLNEMGITVVAMHPGWVLTDMGGNDAEITVEISVSGIRRVLEKVTLTDSGDFLGFDGSRLPW